MRILKFKKKGCPPCEMVEKFLQENKVQYEDIDSLETEDYDLLMKYNVRTVPLTVLLNEQGDIVTKVVGFDSPALNFLINEYNA